MSYYSFATFTVSSKEQIEAAKKYDFESFLCPEQKLEDIIRRTDDVTLEIEFEGLTEEDFDVFIPEFSRFLAETVPGKSFFCNDALGDDSVSYSVIRFNVVYENNHLIVKSLHEGDGWDEYWGALEDMKEIAVLPPYKYIKDFKQFVSDISEEFKCNITDHITEETDFIVTNLHSDDYTDEINEAVENHVKVTNEEEFLNGFELWRFTDSERPWVIEIDEDIN